MPFVPEISAEFSAPPEFSGDVFEKDLSTGWAPTFDFQITNQILFHCATASLFRSFCFIYYHTFLKFFGSEGTYLRYIMYYRYWIGTYSFSVFFGDYFWYSIVRYPVSSHCPLPVKQFWQAVGVIKLAPFPQKLTKFRRFFTMVWNASFR
jgi:hypothetical protein